MRERYDSVVTPSEQVTACSAASPIMRAIDVSGNLIA